MLTITDLSYSIQQTTYLYPISLNIQPGSIITVTGANGAGKTTFLELLVGAKSCTTGNILYNNYSLISQSLQAKQQFFFIPATITSFQNFQVNTYWDLMAQLFGADEAFFSRLVSFAQYFHLSEEYFSKNLGQLSLGTQKKVYFCCAFALQVDFLIFDEPLTGLDVQTQHVFQQLIINKTSNQTIILSSHNETFIQSLTATHLHIQQGHIFTHNEVII